jgi:hypothetical protein
VDAAFVEVWAARFAEPEQVRDARNAKAVNERPGARDTVWKVRDVVAHGFHSCRHHCENHGIGRELRFTQQVEPKLFLVFSETEARDFRSVNLPNAGSTSPEDA